MKKMGLIFVVIGALFLASFVVINIMSNNHKNNVEEVKDEEEYEINDSCISDYNNGPNSLYSYNITFDNYGISFKHLPCMEESKNDLSPNSKIFVSKEGSFIIQFDIIEMADTYEKYVANTMNIRSKIWNSYKKDTISRDEAKLLKNPFNYETYYVLYLLKDDNEKVVGQMATYGIKVSNDKMISVIAFTKDGYLDEGFYTYVFDSIKIDNIK